MKLIKVKSIKNGVEFKINKTNKHLLDLAIQRPSEFLIIEEEVDEINNKDDKIVKKPRRKKGVD